MMILRDFSVTNSYGVSRTVFYGVNQDVTTVSTERQRVMHEAAEKYDAKTEGVFEWLQIFAAGAASFAHGANDVANAIAPLASVFAIWELGNVGNKASVSEWILAYGGVGIDLGLFLFGYRLMRNLGNNLTFLSPSRGLCLKMGSILTVLCATAIELPVSTTHCTTGATVVL
jgi:sodium-dependent phosphate transporter